MGIDFNDADGIEPDILQQAKDGESLMKSAPEVANVIISPETVKKKDGSEQKSINQVLVSSQKNMNVVKQVISQGGFAGADKDKFDISQAHSEWIKARNENIKCPDQIIKTSVRYTSLVNGRAGQNEIVKSHQERINTMDICDKSSDLVLETAKKYVEIDRRVRENRLKEQNTYPVDTETNIIEGFNYYNVDNSVIDNVQLTGGGFTYNQRLPRYQQSDKTTSSNDKSILPWNQYYTQCGDPSSQASCEAAHSKKDTYISSINYLFGQAENKLNVYYNAAVTLTNSSPSSNSISNALVNKDTVSTAILNQQKDIALYKQQALYDYDQYNSLSFIEDMFVFVYYAVFVMFVVVSLRELFSSYVNYDKRNIIILILLGIYPKYILKVVLWLLNGLSEILRMLGLKNVSFWY